jgi:DeoR family suf operon transcriptional repressor
MSKLTKVYIAAFDYYVVMVESISENSDIIGMLGRVKENILKELSYSEKSTAELSELLKINKTAVKEHMGFLEMKGYVRSYFRGDGRGRPSKFYEITDRGIELFPKKYVAFASLLVDTLEKEIGKEKVNVILAKVADRLISEAGWKEGGIVSSMSRSEKIQKLEDFVGILNRLGYYARLEKTPDSVRIVRHNCIFYELAKTNKKIICGTLGSDMISSSLDTNFSIKEKFSDGGKKCVVEISV